MDQAENKEYEIGEKKGKHDVYIVIKSKEWRGVRERTKRGTKKEIHSEFSF